MADETGALSRVLELAEEPTAPAPTVAEAVDAAVTAGSSTQAKEEKVRNRRLL